MRDGRAEYGARLYPADFSPETAFVAVGLVRFFPDILRDRRAVVCIICPMIERKGPGRTQSYGSAHRNDIRAHRF